MNDNDEKETPCGVEGQEELLKRKASDLTVNVELQNESDPFQYTALTSKVVSGTSWVGAGLIIRESVSFLIRLLLARLLLPEHFGLIGMAMVFIGLVKTINELGLTSALVQRKEQELREEHFHTAFWASVIFGLATYCLMLVIIGPFAAWFYKEPTLKIIIAMLSIPLLIRPFSIVHTAKLTRQLRFKVIAVAETVGVVVASVVAVVLAIKGAGVWSIVAQSILIPLVTTPFLWVKTRWIPKTEFSITAFRELFSFGVYMMGHQVVVFFIKNIDYLMIGKMVGATSLGLYTLAFTLTDTFRTKIMGILNRVLYPVYAKLQNDTQAVKGYYLNVLRFNSVLVFPMMAMVAAAAEPIIVVLFGDKWSGAVLPLQWLALAVIINTWGGTAVTVLMGIGKASLNFWLSLVKGLIAFVLLWIGINLGDINGAAVAIVVYNLIIRFINQHYLKRYIDVSEMEIIKALLPSIVGAFASFGSVYFSLRLVTVQNVPSLLGILFIGGSVCMGSLFIVVRNYFEFAKIMWFTRFVKKNKEEQTKKD